MQTGMRESFLFFLSATRMRTTLEERYCEKGKCRLSSESDQQLLSLAKEIANSSLSIHKIRTFFRNTLRTARIRKNDDVFSLQRERYYLDPTSDHSSGFLSNTERLFEHRIVLLFRISFDSEFLVVSGLNR